MYFVRGLILQEKDLQDNVSFFTEILKTEHKGYEY